MVWLIINLMNHQHSGEVNQEKKRLFFALNPPPDVEKEISQLIDYLAKENRGVKWVRGEGTHLTLHFLGYLDEQEEIEIKKGAAEAVGKFGEIKFRLGKINAFPNLARPKIIFLECRQTNGHSANDLRVFLGREILRAGLVLDERPWQTHITIGRNKNNSRLETTDYQPPITSFTVSSFELMESVLSPDGATYYQLESYRL